MEIYEKIRYYREHTDYSQRNVRLRESAVGGDRTTAPARLPIHR